MNQELVDSLDWLLKEIQEVEGYRIDELFTSVRIALQETLRYMANPINRDDEQLHQYARSLDNWIKLTKSRIDEGAHNLNHLQCLVEEILEL